MTSPIFKDLSTGIESLNLDEDAKQVFRDFVRGVRVAHGDGDSIDREDRHEFSAKLLAKKIPRAEIRERLMTRFQLSRRQAYRVIEESLRR